MSRTAHHYRLTNVLTEHMIAINVAFSSLYTAQNKMWLTESYIKLKFIHFVSWAYIVKLRYRLFLEISNVNLYPFYNFRPQALLIYNRE